MEGHFFFLASLQVRKDSARALPTMAYIAVISEQLCSGVSQDPEKPPEGCSTDVIGFAVLAL